MYTVETQICCVSVAPLFRHKRRCPQPRQIKNRLHRSRQCCTFYDDAKQFIRIQRNDAHLVSEEQNFIVEGKLVLVHQQDLNQVRIVLFWEKRVNRMYALNRSEEHTSEL